MTKLLISYSRFLKTSSSSISELKKTFTDKPEINNPFSLYKLKRKIFKIKKNIYAKPGTNRTELLIVYFKWALSGKKNPLHKFYLLKNFYYFKIKSD